MARIDMEPQICIMSKDNNHDLVFSPSGNLFSCVKCKLMWGYVRDRHGEIINCLPLVGVKAVHVEESSGNVTT